MGVVLVTGSAGLIGAETVRRFIAAGYTVAGVDNNMPATSGTTLTTPIPATGTWSHPRSSPWGTASARTTANSRLTAAVTLAKQHEP